MKTLLLTGASGFLGSNLARFWLGKGYRVVALRRRSSVLDRLGPLRTHIVWFDLEDDGLRQSLRQHPIDAIVHCATNYGRGAVPSVELVEANLILPLTLLQEAETRGVRVFLNSDTILDKAVSEYSLSKKQFLDWLRHYSNRLICANVALEHFYGPSDDESKFATFVILAILRNEARIGLTTGFQKRDFIFIDDVVRGFDLILEDALLRAGSATDGALQEYEVGSGQPISIREFVHAVKELAGNTLTHIDFGALPLRTAEVMESAVDLRSLRSLGWAPRTSLIDGLTRTLELERHRIG
jgi:nucleoside-diphosphate-sugar epimerase